MPYLTKQKNWHTDYMDWMDFNFINQDCNYDNGSQIK